VAEITTATDRTERVPLFVRPRQGEGHSP